MPGALVASSAFLDAPTGQRVLTRPRRAPFHGASSEHVMRVGFGSAHTSLVGQSAGAHVQCAMATDPGAVLHPAGSGAPWYVGGVTHTFGVPPEGILPEGHSPASVTRKSAPPDAMSSTQTLPSAHGVHTPASP